MTAALISPRLQTVREVRNKGNKKKTTQRKSPPAVKQQKDK